MKTTINVTMKTTLIMPLLLLTVLAVSCTSTGEYKPLSNEETVIGTVQTTFEVRSSFFFMASVKNKVNTQAYINLLEAAGKKYSGNIDIRDIVWVTGKPVKRNEAFTEIFASGKVIRFDLDEEKQLPAEE